MSLTLVKFERALLDKFECSVLSYLNFIWYQSWNLFSDCQAKTQIPWNPFCKHLYYFKFGDFDAQDQTPPLGTAQSLLMHNWAM